MHCATSSHSGSPPMCSSARTVCATEHPLWLQNLKQQRFGFGTEARSAIWRRVLLQRQIAPPAPCAAPCAPPTRATQTDIETRWCDHTSLHVQKVTRLPAAPPALRAALARTVCRSSRRRLGLIAVCWIELDWIGFGFRSDTDAKQCPRAAPRPPPPHFLEFFLCRSACNI